MVAYQYATISVRITLFGTLAKFVYKGDANNVFLSVLFFPRRGRASELEALLYLNGGLLYHHRFWLRRPVGDDETFKVFDYVVVVV